MVVQWVFSFGADCSIFQPKAETKAASLSRSLSSSLSCILEPLACKGSLKDPSRIPTVPWKSLRVFPRCRWIGGQSGIPLENLVRIVGESRQRLPFLVGQQLIVDDESRDRRQMLIFR